MSGIPTDLRHDGAALLPALLAHARRRGGREVLATADGVVVLDGGRRRLPVTQGGDPFPARADTLHAALVSLAMARRGFAFDRFNAAPAWDFGDLGEWTFERGDGTLSLKPSKPGPSCVDALFASAPGDMALVRALYGRPGVDVIVICEGEARSRDLAKAIVSELSETGVPATLRQEKPSSDGHYRTYPDPHAGLEPFDQPGTQGVTPWSVSYVDEFGWRAALSIPGKPDGEGRVIVASMGRTGHASVARVIEAVGSRTVAIVRVAISPEDSRPRMDVGMTAGAAALARSPMPAPENATWTRLAAKRDARAATAKPRTWHGTTDQVARAFVERVAPVGKVSGDALWFEGPVAWSDWARNPIAAFVRDVGGNDVIVMGRARSGGSRAGLVTMAQDDIRRAAHDRFEILDVDADLHPLLRWDRDDRPVKGPQSARAKLDAEATGAWLAAAMAKLAAVRRDKATGAKHPTLGHGRAIEDMCRLAELRDTLSVRLGLELPFIGDPRLLRAEANAVLGAAQARRDAQAAARDARIAPGRESEEGDPPSPGM